MYSKIVLSLPDGIKTFSMIGIHIKPRAAVQELKTLHHVVESTIETDSEVSAEIPFLFAAIQQYMKCHYFFSLFID